MRLGPWCVFKEHPVKFLRITAKHLVTLTQEQQRQRLADLCTGNARSLLKAVEFCHKNKIDSFRKNSQILPLKIHPEMGYDIAELPGSD